MLVNRSAIQSNFLKLSSMTSGDCAAIVKGDAYGHGMLESAHALLDVGTNLFFSARFEDAVTLRKNLGSKVLIGVLDGFSSNCVYEALALELLPVVNSLEQLELIVSAARRYDLKPKVFVHLDTAMNRLGLAPEDDEEALPHLVSVNILAYMTHFASADDLDVDLCRRQVASLKSRVAKLPNAPLSIANSCGVFLGNEFHGQIIRPGKSTFGINPLVDADNPMKEPASVFSPVVQIRNIGIGDPVGYSCTWRAPKASRIAVLAIGYSNGFMRQNSNLGNVAFREKLAPVVGRVSMDLTAVDVSAFSEEEVHIGSIAEIVGQTVNYRTLAETVGTNEHEALISLGQGCPRFHVEMS